MIPLLKTGSQTEIQNYRPIALLQSLTKGFEKRLHKHICNYIGHHKLFIDSNNSGIWKEHSTLAKYLQLFVPSL